MNLTPGKFPLHWQILLALILAIIAGYFSGMDGSLFGLTLFHGYEFVGTLFLNSLKMIIVPLIMASIISGISGVGHSKDLGRLGLKTISFYLISSLLAILTGLILVNAITPGIIDNKPSGASLGLNIDENQLAATVEKVAGHDNKDLARIFLRMVPPNIVAAAANGQMLGLIFFSLLFGYFMTGINSRNSQTMIIFWQGVYETMMGITMWIMRFAPLGVFGLVAKTVATTGFTAFKPLLAFFITVVLALAVHTLITLPALLLIIGRVNPRHHFQALMPALLTACSTASSSATLPLTIECVEKNAGVSNRVSSFVLPLGATVNMDGTALYECVAAIFIAQAYGIELSFTIQFTIILVALLTSIGVAGIPSASLVAITIILTAIGLPIEALGLILVTDRVLDMCRTGVNVLSDSCAAVIIAKTEGEKTRGSIKSFV